MKRLILSEDCWLDLDVAECGIPDHRTMSVYRTFPLAQHPRSQLVLQVTAPIHQLWDIGTCVHAALVPHHSHQNAAGSKKAA